jgi:3',5'-nucleoside bisphosphate phosphatase
MKIKADLHIHSCLSPCGSLDMSPSVIAKQASAAGLDLIALADHNSALNCPALEKSASSYPGLVCLYGLELCSTEEVHALALFGDSAEALSFGDFIYSHLPDIINNPEDFGDQVYVDENENILGSVDKLLTAGCDLSVDELEVLVHRRGGLFIPAHVDRGMFSMTSQLGFLPEGNYDAIEFSAKYVRDGRDPHGIDLAAKYAWITGSDSHYPDGIGSAYTEIECGEKSFAGISEALKRKRVQSYSA